MLIILLEGKNSKYIKSSTITTTYKPMNHSNNKKERDLAICQLAVQGKSQAEIAKTIGNIGQTGVSRIIRKKENRKLIEKETTKLLSSLPEIVNQFEENVELSKTLMNYISTTGEEENPTKIKEIKDILSFLNLAYKQKSDMLKALGVFPSQNLSMFIQNIYNDNRKQVLSPEVFKAFGSMFEDNDEDSAEEAEII